MSNSNSLLQKVLKFQKNFQTGKPIHILFCDIQDKYLPKIYNYKDIISTSEDIAEASKLLNLNQIITEHKKEIFGETIGEIKKHYYEKTQVLSKTRFSMVDEEMLKSHDKDSVYVLLGIEAHVCVTQTALSILDYGRELIILSDGVSSVNRGDRNVALRNLSNLGAYVTTSQSFLFLLLKDAKHPSFKFLLPILKRFSERENKLLNEAKF